MSVTQRRGLPAALPAGVLSVTMSRQATPVAACPLPNAGIRAESDYLSVQYQ